MNGTDDLGPAPAEQGGNITALFLGLYLLILAFFIVLVSISSFEEVRSRAVMDSLSSTFASLLPPTTTLTGFASLEGDALAGHRFQEEVTRIFSAAIQVVRIDVTQPGRAMRLRMPATAFFEDGSAAIRPAQVDLIDRTVAALSGAPPGLRHEMEFVLGAEMVDPGAMPIGQTLAMERIGVFAREMAARGAPPGGVTVGLRPGHADELLIWFQVVGGDESRLQLDEAEAEARRRNAPPALPRRAP